MAGGIGSSVSDNVAKQIEARKKVIGKKTDKTNDDLLYTTSRTGWVRLSSSVNTLTKEEAARLKELKGRLSVKGSNRLADYNVLQGGLLNPNRTLRKGMNVYNEVSDTDVADKAAYQNRANSTGIRPMPGITGMTVKSKNTLGTLREAEVKFQVWTLEDFENMEKLYLRPGFTMLLEWGHSIYVNNKAELITSIQTVDSRFFKDGVTMQQILDEISRIRGESFYNYEGMVGYVKNFSWSYNVNGGYDCSINIISTGEILESLKIAFDPAQRISVTEVEKARTDQAKQHRKSMYHYFIQLVQELDSKTFTKEDLADKAPTLISKLEDFTGYYQHVQLDDTGAFDEDTPMHWVTIRTLFDIFNKFIVTVDTTKPVTDPNRQYVTINTNYDLSSKFLTCPEHFTIDPTVCVLMSTTQIQSTTTLGTVVSTTADFINAANSALAQVVGESAAPVINPNIAAGMTSAENIKVNNIHDNLQIPQGSTTDDVLNILISLPYLKLKLDELIDADGKSDKSIYDLFRAIFDGMETALGGVNDFDLAYDDETSKYFLVDRNNTPPKTQKTPEFILTGLDSIFTEINMSSKITNNIGSQISVAAQGSTLNYSENVENILKWNPNVIDRVRPVKDTTTAPIDSEAAAEEDRLARIQDWLDDVAEYYISFNSFFDGYDQADLEAAKTLHAEWTSEKVNKHRQRNKEEVPGLVPVELSFKLDGIGGFKIGETFRIASGILPSEYQGKFGYIVTGLEHSLDSKNRWETSITALFYFLGQQATIV
jgi:hypothetical protein